MAASVYTRTLYQVKNLAHTEWASPGEGRVWIVRNIDVWVGEVQVLPWGRILGPEEQGIWAWSTVVKEPQTLIGGYHDHYEGRFVIEGLQRLWIVPEEGAADVTITGFDFAEPAGAPLPLTA